MRVLLLGVFCCLSLACSPMYGRESCMTNAQCSVGGQTCANSCELGDAGPGVTRSWICQKVCAEDADCSSLGLKKPRCITNQCANGSKTCVDYPF